MRSAGASVEAAAGTPVDELNRLLAEESATIHPVFGVNERRIEAARSARPGAAEALAPLSVFYSVRAEDGKLDDMAAKLARMPGVMAAYVKPAAEPPLAPPSAGGVEPVIAAALVDAPPVTPDFTARQRYLDVAPGVDAHWA